MAGVAISLTLFMYTYASLDHGAFRGAPSVFLPRAVLVRDRIFYAAIRDCQCALNTG
jgi:hypothetical protein